MTIGRWRSWVLVGTGVAMLMGAPRARATWSIVLGDTRTKALAVGTATCVSGANLRREVALIRVGVGASANQSAVDVTGANRMLIWDELEKGTHPRDIIELVKASDANWRSRQIGIVDLTGQRGALTGGGAGGWAGHTLGREGDLVYSIQGNVLTGEAVILAAEQAVLNTPGDLAAKLMAGMEAAAAMGGDGRCSCPGLIVGCGSPPDDFDKSAHVGTILVARYGDFDGVCNALDGCASGNYFLTHNVIAGATAPEDPVSKLRSRYNAWRASLRGVVDQLQSTMSIVDRPVPGNGTFQTQLEVVLRDWEGNQLTNGGATLIARHAESSDGLAFLDEAIDHGDGTYTIPLVAGAAPGSDAIEIVVNDGEREVLLYPPIKLKHLETLTADASTISGIDGATVQFDYVGPEAVPGREYLLLMSLSGTSPGIDRPFLHIPLNFDGMFLATYLYRNTGHFVNTWGTLAPDGTGFSQLVANPGSLSPFVGTTIDCAMVTLNPMDFASNPWTLTVDL